jgi:hypothetical protein
MVAVTMVVAALYERRSAVAGRRYNPSKFLS